jgi:hypothetical protein
MQTKFFLRFKATNVGACIGQWTFELRKPLFVKPMQDQNTCCCIYHVELDELRLGLNNMRGQGNSEKVCSHHEHKVHAHLAKSLTKASHACGSLLFVPKVILMNGIRKNVCMEIVQLVV